MKCPCCDDWRYWLDKEGKFVVCTECGNTGVAHCCEGLCEQPEESDDHPGNGGQES